MLYVRPAKKVEQPTMVSEIKSCPRGSESPDYNSLTHSLDRALLQGSRAAQYAPYVRLSGRNLRLQAFLTDLRGHVLKCHSSQSHGGPNR